MAEERTLGLARAQEHTAEEPSKEELQRRMDEARDSISNTVTEIKETVANQVQAVKDTLDWREQFKRRPVAWSAAAMGVGILRPVIALPAQRATAAITLGHRSLRSRVENYATQGIVSGAAMLRPRNAKPNKGTARTTLDQTFFPESSPNTQRLRARAR